MGDEAPPTREGTLAGKPASHPSVGLPRDGIQVGAPGVAARSEVERPDKPGQQQGWLTRTLGWLTFVGLLITILAVIMQNTLGPNAANTAAAAINEAMANSLWPYPLPFTLLVCGACCFFLAGIPWAHTCGQSKLKVAYLGVVGFVSGGVLGLGVGTLDMGAIAARPADRLSAAILWVVVGFWLGAILFAAVGISWGIWFHRRYGCH